MGFSRQECWSGLPFPSPGDLPNPGIEPRSPTLQADALPSEPPGKHYINNKQVFLVAQIGKRLPPMRETRVWPLGWEDPLEKEMTTHSSTLAWIIPWMEEHGRLQSMGSQRVGHDWATSLSLSINRKWCYRKKYFKQKHFYFNWIQTPRGLMYLW